MKPDISGPSNPQFEEEVEHVSLDDVTVSLSAAFKDFHSFLSPLQVEENPEDIEMQTAHAKHRRHVLNYIHMLFAKSGPTIALDRLLACI